MPRGYPLDLVGQTFGDWEVLSKHGLGPGKKMLWDCQCACGRLAVQQTGNLTGGKTRRCRSCGNRKENSARWNKK